MKAEMKLRSKQNVIFDAIQQSDAVDFKQATIKRLIYHEDTEEVNVNYSHILIFASFRPMNVRLIIHLIMIAVFENVL